MVLVFVYVVGGCSEVSTNIYLEIPASVCEGLIGRSLPKNLPQLEEHHQEYYVIP